MASENGIVGILVFGGLLIATFAALMDAWRRFKRAGRTNEKEVVVWLAIMLIGYLVSALSLHGAFLYILFLQISLIIAARQISRSLTSMQLSGLIYQPGYSEAIQSLPASLAYSEVLTYGQVRIRERITSILAEFAATASAIEGRPPRQPNHPAIDPSMEAEPISGSPVKDTTGLTYDPANLQTGDSARLYDTRFDSDWLAAAAAALMRGNTNVARAMVDMALQQDCYDVAAWALSMRLQQVEQGIVKRVGVEDYIADRKAGMAMEMGGRNGAASPGYEVDEKFHRYWRVNGGLPVFGYPISQRFAEFDSAGTLVEVQYFERARLEYNPKRAGTPLEVVPGKLGMEVTVRGTVEMQLPAGLEGERVIFTTKGTGMPTPHKFFAFWESNGGPNLFGYPITPLLIDTRTGGKALAVQYFEKACFEYHPEHAGTVYEVQISKLGVELFDNRYGQPERWPVTSYG